MENNIINADCRTKETIIAEVKATISHVETTAMLGAIKIGKCYMELKELVPHGEWYNYIEENTGHTPKKVERFMKIASEYGDENTTLGSLFSKTTISSDLSIYKALTLIAVPDEEVENFVENNDIKEMTVKELEQKVKELQAEKEVQMDRVESMSEDYVVLMDEKQDLNNEVNNLKKEIERLVAATPDINEIPEEALREIEEKRTELIEAERKVQEAEDKANSLMQEIDELKENHQSIITRAVEEAKEEARKETEEEMQGLMATVEQASKAKVDAEKKLEASSNRDLVEFSIFVNELQKDFHAAIGILEVVRANDPEQGAKLAAGLKAIMETLNNKVAS